MGTSGELGRCPEIQPDELTPAQSEIASRILEGPRGRMPVPFRIWLHSPQALDRLERLGLYLLRQSSLTRRQIEIAILVGAQHWRADYEWWAHQRHAQAQGIPAAVIEAIRSGAVPDLSDPSEQIVYRVSTALHRREAVTDEMAESAIAHLGHDGASDLFALMGYYATVAFTFKFYDVPAPEGARYFDAGEPQLPR
jgi:4-carboxymuconolactone decarboxylase